MLSRLYKLSCNEALRYTQEFHDARKYPQNVRSPQTAIQRTQVGCHCPTSRSLRLFSVDIGANLVSKRVHVCTTRTLSGVFV